MNLPDSLRNVSQYVFARRGDMVQVPKDAPLWQELRDAADMIDQLNQMMHRLVHARLDSSEWSEAMDAIGCHVTKAKGDE